MPFIRPVGEAVVKQFTPHAVEAKLFKGAPWEPGGTRLALVALWTPVLFDLGWSGGIGTLRSGVCYRST